MYVCMYVCTYKYIIHKQKIYIHLYLDGFGSSCALLGPVRNPHTFLQGLEGHLQECRFSLPSSELMCIHVHMHIINIHIYIHMYGDDDDYICMRAPCAPMM